MSVSTEYFRTRVVYMVDRPMPVLFGLDTYLVFTEQVIIQLFYGILRLTTTYLSRVLTLLPSLKGQFNPRSQQKMTFVISRLALAFVLSFYH